MNENKEQPGMAGAARQGGDTKAECVCGEPETTGTTHRTDGPCHVAERPSVPSVAQSIDTPASKVLADFAKELDRITWEGEDAGWNLAITAVQKRIGQLLAASPAAQTAPATPAETELVKHGDVQSIEITLRQAEKLVEFFGGHDGEVSVIERPAAWSDQPAGLYAYCTEYPDEGAQYLGPTEVDDDLAMNGRPATPAPAAPQAVQAQVLEQIAQSWDGCTFDAPGEMMNIGEALRRQFKQLATATEAREAAAEEARDRMREKFEALASDSYDFKKSRKGTYQNPAVARDWKWFQLGVTAADDAKDAARYRYLRGSATDIGNVIDKEFAPGKWEYRAGDELDNAIDAALRSTSQAPAEGGANG
jgi:hypothetical protein